MFRPLFSPGKAFPLEYHVSVRHSIPASVALFSLLAFPVGFVSSSHAQINGVSSSVTSPGFGGRPVNGTPPSVTSLGPGGYSPRVTFTAPPFAPPRQDAGSGHHHSHHRDADYPPVFYAVPVPYVVDNTAPNNDADAEDDDANYQGGPTVFDRRGSGEDSYVPPVRNVPQAHAVQSASSDPPAPEPPQEPTVLVFKDGHKIEVGNYAILGATLFDLTPGHPRKLALADLDLDATSKENEDRGVTFQIPPSPQAN